MELPNFGFVEMMAHANWFFWPRSAHLSTLNFVVLFNDDVKYSFVCATKKSIIYAFRFN